MKALSGDAEVTIKDIARLAGVSISTVSRVVNGTGLVAPEKSKAVEDVLATVQYIPNHSARALVKRRTQTIGLIVPTLANPIFAPSIEGAEQALAAAGYGLLISCSDRSPERELTQAKTMMERGVEGLILTGSYHHPDLMPLMASRGVLAVSQDDPIGADGLLTVAMPDAEAMACAIDALVEHSHRRIGIITGPTADTRPIADRVRGARARLAALGLAVDEEDVAETTDYSAAAAQAATARLLSSGRDYTALACTGDILAIGVIRECRRAGLVVPGDISVTGCGETVMAQYVDPPLTTVRLPFRALGELAASLLVSHLNGRATESPGPLPFAFVEGASVAAAPAEG